MRKQRKKQKSNKQKDIIVPVVANVDIDYDKLAEAMVKANAKAEEQKQQQNTLDKGISKFTKAIFIAIGIFCIIFAVCGGYAIYQFLISANWENRAIIIGNIFACLLMLALIAYIVLLALYLFKCAKEIEKEKDRNYIIAIFSTIVAFVALIVSIIALKQS